jgi:hypothetical protein
MSLLKIATIGHPVLRERASDVTANELADAWVQKLVDDRCISRH